MDEEIIKKKIATMLPVLDEKQTRLYLASEAQSIGWGGQSKIAALSGWLMPKDIASPIQEMFQNYHTISYT
ncbi:hypothetical protein AGMMS50239_25930 [Bacteroidia bacterium]|nr:hypothetical protein FACS1894207_0550 [Bacteroidia bacterium]GHT65666.1 hypothetical protein AGMMS50239_25930 [Bacteroidia bacterium]